MNIPVGLFLLFLTGVGPLLAWRRTSLDSLKRNFGWPLLGGLFGGTLLFGFGWRHLYALTCLILALFVALTIFSEFYRGARVIRSRTGLSFLSSLVHLTLRNTRRYGGYVVHFGMVLIFIGLAGAAFNQDVQMAMRPGTQFTLGSYTLICQTFEPRNGRNYTADRATIEVLQGGKQLMMLYPERRLFQPSEETGTMVSIYSTVREDLYVVYAGRDPDTNLPVIHAYLNPLVKWIWFGGVIVALGTALALVPSRQAVLVLQAAAEPSNLSPAPSPALPHGITTYGTHD